MVCCCWVVVVVVEVEWVCVDVCFKVQMMMMMGRWDVLMWCLDDDQEDVQLYFNAVFRTNQTQVTQVQQESEGNK